MLPIHVAARSGCKQLVQVLVDREPELVNKANSQDARSPLHYAVEVCVVAT